MIFCRCLGYFFMRDCFFPWRYCAGAEAFFLYCELFFFATCDIPLVLGLFKIARFGFFFKLRYCAGARIPIGNVHPRFMGDVRLESEGPGTPTGKCYVCNAWGMPNIKTLALG